MAARAGYLVGHNTEELSAESEQHLLALSMSISLGDEHDATGQTSQAFECDSPSNYLWIAGQFGFATEIRRQILAAIETCDLLRVMFSHKSHAFPFPSRQHNELRVRQPHLYR